nr:hypothetical protein JVH1_9124 [Rhodococcus sp. JVH1]
MIADVDELPCAGSVSTNAGTGESGTSAFRPARGAGMSLGCPRSSA